MQDGKIMPVDGREKWSPMQKILHWSVVGLCLAQIPTSWAIARTHVAHHFGLAPQPVDLMLHKVHAVSGGLIFLAACLRLWLRRGAFDAGRSVEPGYRRGILDLAAAVTHACLYLLILVLPITGFLALPGPSARNRTSLGPREPPCRGRPLPCGRPAGRCIERHAAGQVAQNTALNAGRISRPQISACIEPLRFDVKIRTSLPPLSWVRRCGAMGITVV